jgi:hypothetical protein
VVFSGSAQKNSVFLWLSAPRANCILDVGSTSVRL